MPFKIKDLMIGSLPSGKAADIGARTDGCSGGETTDWVDLLFTPPATSVAALAILKERLHRQLAEVDKQLVAAEESLRPQTVEEVDMLTGKLKEALEELKVRRAELSKKPKPPGKK
jgi:hypothetical protein